MDYLGKVAQVFKSNCDKCEHCCYLIKERESRPYGEGVAYETLLYCELLEEGVPGGTCFALEEEDDE